MAVARQYVEKDYYTEAEYFEVDENSFGRWEYVDGQIRLMAGGTGDHSTIAANLIRALGNALVPKGCLVHGSDMKVRCGDGTITYPDLSVVCGAREYYGGRTDVLTNPLLLVEVLSPSTASYDRAEKFDHYQTIPALADYLLVTQDEARVMLLTRDGSDWTFRAVSGREAVLHLPSVDVTLALSDVYALIDSVP